MLHFSWIYKLWQLFREDWSFQKITENADPNEELEIDSVEGDLDESISDTSSHSIGVNGLLVPVEQPMQLVDRISQLIQQPDRVAQMKQAARETVINSFSMKKMVTELEDIYNNLINK